MFGNETIAPDDGFSFLTLWYFNKWLSELIFGLPVNQFIPIANSSPDSPTPPSPIDSLW
jgi:hypothetical protein